MKTQYLINIFNNQKKGYKIEIQNLVFTNNKKSKRVIFILIHRKKNKIIQLMINMIILVFNKMIYFNNPNKQLLI